jgi:hypothetical protein
MSIGPIAEKCQIGDEEEARRVVDRTAEILVGAGNTVNGLK